MKLLFCRSCQDIFSLRQDTIRYCACGKVSGRYSVGGIQAWYNDLDGEAVMIGIANPSLVKAIQNVQTIETYRRDGFAQCDDQDLLNFKAFTIARPCPTFTKGTVMPIDSK